MGGSPIREASRAKGCLKAHGQFDIDPGEVIIMFRIGRGFGARLTLLMILAIAVLASAQTVQEVAEEALPATVTIRIPLYEKGSGRYLGETGGSGFLIWTRLGYIGPSREIMGMTPGPPSRIISEEDDLAMLLITYAGGPCSHSVSPTEAGIARESYEVLYVITNAHVVQPRDHIYVQDEGSCRSVSIRQGEVQFVFADGRTLSLEALPLPSEELQNIPALLFSWMETSELHRGDEVVIIGSPLFYSGTVTTGRIANLHQTTTFRSHECDPSTRTLHDLIMIDGTTTSGNSGGPVLSMRVGPFGVTVLGVAVGWIPGTGFGWAIPIEKARNLLFRNFWDPFGFCPPPPPEPEW